MATPILNAVSKDLAYKLQDPVTAGTTDGERLTADERLVYITRAYRRLLRLVTMLYPALIEKLFQLYYETGVGTTDSSGEFDASTFAEVYTVYCKQPGDENYVKAEFIPADVYLDVKNGYNDFYTPDINTDRYYWSNIGGKIKLLPPLTLNLELADRANTAYNIETNGYGGDYDLDIPTEHTDLLLSFAAVEAYMDIGQTDMVQMFLTDASNQLQILAGIKKEKETKDEIDENS